ALAAEGAKVALTARDAGALEAAHQAVGEASSIHVADVTDPQAAKSLVRDVEARLGRLDVLVCNVGSGASVAPGTETA
ncbi:SDR family NAD(P)-dependent oxidoreductase, partial [Aeromonas veronii]|uniref:SDR family NAD(P)-dependent oxidoreductase n=1 Tax=Aeromonas veronii TaxID=654 RepID=UPI00406C8796